MKRVLNYLMIAISALAIAPQAGLGKLNGRDCGFEFGGGRAFAIDSKNHHRSSQSESSPSSAAGLRYGIKSGTCSAFGFATPWSLRYR
jgi:hypothetical protein